MTRNRIINYPLDFENSLLQVELPFELRRLPDDLQGQHPEEFGATAGETLSF